MATAIKSSPQTEAGESEEISNINDELVRLCKQLRWIDAYKSDLQHKIVTCEERLQLSRRRRKSILGTVRSWFCDSN